MKCHLANSNMLVELQDTIFARKREVAQSGQIAKEYHRLEKIDKQNNTMLNPVCKIRSYLTIAVLVIAILIAIILQLNSSLNSLHGRLEEDSNKHFLQLNLLQNRLEEDSKKHLLQLNSLQNRLEENSNMYILKLNSLQNKLEEDTKMHKQNFTELQQQNALLQEVLNKTVADLHQLSSSVWSMKHFGLQNEFFNQISPTIMKMPSFTKKVMDKEE